MDIVQHHCANLTHSTNPYLWPSFLPFSLFLSLPFFLFSFLFSFFPSVPTEKHTPSPIRSREWKLSLHVLWSGYLQTLLQLQSMLITRLGLGSWLPFHRVWDLSTGEHNVHRFHRCVPGLYESCTISLCFRFWLPPVTGHWEFVEDLHPAAHGVLWDLCRPCCPTHGLEKAVGPYGRPHVMKVCISSERLLWDSFSFCLHE